MKGIHATAALLAAALLASSPRSQSQQAPTAPASATTPATAAQLRLQREAEAWNRGSAQAIVDHARIVASTAGPRDLLAAAILSRSLSLSLVDPANATAPPRETRVWFAAATSARPRDRLIAWHELGGVFLTDAKADHPGAMAFLLSDDPGNAAVHLRAMAMAEAAGDTALAQLHWEQAAASERHDAYTLEMGSALLSALRGVSLPPLTQELAIHFGDSLGLPLPVSEDDMASVVASSLWAAVALPWLTDVSRRCSVQAVAEAGAARRSECLQMMHLLAADESSMFTPGYGLRRAVELSAPGPDRERRIERLREFHWLRQTALNTLSGGPRALEVPRGYVEQVLSEGEIPAIRGMLDLNGIPLQPPAGWLPEDPSVRALLGAPAAG